MSANIDENATAQPMIPNEKPIESNKRNQYLGGLAVSLGGFCGGTVLAWTSPALEYLVENDNKTLPSIPGFKISTPEEASIAATLMIGGLLFAIPSGKFANIFGRKITLLLISALYLANYIVLACSKNVMMLVVARFFAGLALGGSCVVGPMYLGEIAEKSLRGTLGSLFNVLLSMGILYTNAIGIFSNWVGLSIGLSLSSVAFAVSLILLPDTPVYLVSTERFGKARKSLMFYRGNEKIAAEELTELKTQTSARDTEGTLVELFTKKRYRRSLIAGLGVFVYQQFCGINTLQFYLVPIFRAAGSALNPLVAATVTNLISLFAGIAAIFVIEKRNRKYYLILSSASMFAGTAGLGLFFQLKQFNVDFWGLQVLPVFCVVIFLAGFAVGLGPVPWILLIELYTPEIRGIASGVNIVFNWLAAFFCTFSYPYLMRSIGSAWTFYLYGWFNVLGFLFVWFIIPETKCKK